MSDGARLRVLGLVLVFLVSCSTARTGKEPGTLDRAGISLIHGFQTVISPVDGDRCMMLPSCSAYTEQAIRNHGFLMGWIMGCDRLMRCGHDELYRSEVMIQGGETYCLDPVADNDFWWYGARP